MCIVGVASSFQQSGTLTANPPRDVSLFGLHVRPGIPHRPDHLIQRHVVRSVAAQRQRGGVDGADGAERLRSCRIF
jgi:hypothetical protein